MTVGREGLVAFISSPNSGLYLAGVDRFLECVPGRSWPYSNYVPHTAFSKYAYLECSLPFIVRYSASLKSLNCKMCCYCNYRILKTGSKIECSECSRQ
jgi:hypothetical protein